jgi:hypothetical protein
LIATTRERGKGGRKRKTDMEERIDRMEYRSGGEQWSCRKGHKR